MSNESTMQPFAPGDVFLGCTLLNDPDDDHAGDGRILQFDEQLRPKGVLWTKGTRHLVGGLSFDLNGLLWAFDDHTVIHIDPEYGRQLPLADFPPRVYRSASFARDGSVYLGEHLCAEAPPPGIEKMTTIEFPRIPDSGALGYGKIYKFNADWALEQTFDVDLAPEFTGFKGVTHSCLHPSDAFITYTTETGKRLMRYDVVNDRQMPDLRSYPGDDLRTPPWVIGGRYMPDGRLLLLDGTSFEALDEDGLTLLKHPLPEYGWAEITPCHDGEHALAANIFSGRMVKVDISSGEIVGGIQTDMKKPHRSLAGVAEYPG